MGDFVRIQSKINFYRSKFIVGCGRLYDGDKYFKKRQFQEALQNYRKAVEFLGECEDIKPNVIICLQNQEANGTGVEETADRWTLKNEKRGHLYTKASFYFAIENFHKSLEVLHELNTEFPDFTSGRILKWELILIKGGHRSLCEVKKEKESLLKQLECVPSSEIWLPEEPQLRPEWYQFDEVQCVRSKYKSTKLRGL